jgi:hypothetical protein
MSDCPSDKAHVRPIWVNAMMTLDKVKPELLLHGGCHIASTLDGWMQASITLKGLECARLHGGAYGCLRGAHGCLGGAHSFVRGTHGYRRGAHDYLRSMRGCCTGTHGSLRGIYRRRGHPCMGGGGGGAMVWVNAKKSPKGHKIALGRARSRGGAHKSPMGHKRAPKGYI